MRAREEPGTGWEEPIPGLGFETKFTYFNLSRYEALYKRISDGLLPFSCPLHVAHMFKAILINRFKNLDMFVLIGPQITP